MHWTTNLIVMSYWQKILVFLTCVSFMCSCGGTETSSDDNFVFEETIDLVGEEVFANELYWIVDVAGPYIFFEQNANQNELYHVYNAADMTFLGEVGKRGQGPGEFYGAQYSGQSENRSGEISIWVNDAPRFRISSINITASLRLGETVINRSIRHHPRYNFQNALFVLGESKLVGHQPGFIPETNLNPLNILNDDVLRPIGDYPEISNIEEVSGGERRSKVFNKAAVAMKSDQSRFVVAMGYYDRLDIYDVQGMLVKSLRDPMKYVSYNAHEIFDADTRLIHGIQFYKTLTVTDNFIYAVYHDRKLNVDTDKNKFSTEIRV